MSALGIYYGVQSRLSAPHGKSDGSSFYAFAGLILDLFIRFECTRNVKYCRGFLIDGDQADKWREFSNTQITSVRGSN